MSVRQAQETQSIGFCKFPPVRFWLLEEFSATFQVMLSIFARQAIAWGCSGRRAHLHGRRRSRFLGSISVLFDSGGKGLLLVSISTYWRSLWFRLWSWGNFSTSCGNFSWSGSNFGVFCSFVARSILGWWSWCVRETILTHQDLIGFSEVTNEIVEIQLLDGWVVEPSFFGVLDDLWWTEVLGRW